MDIPLYISIPLIVAFVHYDNHRRAWRHARAKLRRWWHGPTEQQPPQEPESQIVLPGGKVMKIGVTNVQTSCAVNDVLRGSAEFFIFDDEGRATIG